MECKGKPATRSKSGISRIFSISLKQAITSKKISSETSKSSRLSVSPKSGEDTGQNGQDHRTEKIGSAEDAKENSPSSVHKNDHVAQVRSEAVDEKSDGVTGSPFTSVSDKSRDSVKPVSSSTSSDSSKRASTGSDTSLQKASSVSGTSGKRDCGIQDEQRKRTERNRRRSDPKPLDSKSQPPPKVSKSPSSSGPSQGSCGSQSSVVKRPSQHLHASSHAVSKVSSNSQRSGAGPVGATSLGVGHKHPAPAADGTSRGSLQHDSHSGCPQQLKTLSSTSSHVLSGSSPCSQPKVRSSLTSETVRDSVHLCSSTSSTTHSSSNGHQSSIKNYSSSSTHHLLGTRVNSRGSVDYEGTTEVDEDWNSELLEVFFHDSTSHSDESLNKISSGGGYKDGSLSSDGFPGTPGSSSAQSDGAELRKEREVDRKQCTLIRKSTEGSVTDDSADAEVATVLLQPASRARLSVISNRVQGRSKAPPLRQEQKVVKEGTPASGGTVAKHEITSGGQAAVQSSSSSAPEGTVSVSKHQYRIRGKQGCIVNDNNSETESRQAEKASHMKESRGHQQDCLHQEQPASTTGGLPSLSGTAQSQRQETASLRASAVPDTSETEENWELELMQVTPDMSSPAEGRMECSMPPLHVAYCENLVHACQQKLAVKEHSTIVTRSELLVDDMGIGLHETQVSGSEGSENRSSDHSGRDDSSSEALISSLQQKLPSEQFSDKIETLQQAASATNAVNSSSIHPGREWGCRQKTSSGDAFGSGVSSNWTAPCHSGDIRSPGFSHQRSQIPSGSSAGKEELEAESSSLQLSWPNLTWEVGHPESASAQNSGKPQDTASGRNQESSFRSLKHRHAEGVRPSQSFPELPSNVAQPYIRQHMNSFGESDVSCGSRVSDNSDFQIATLSQSDTESCLQMRHMGERSQQVAMAKEQGTQPELNSHPPQQFPFKGDVKEARHGAYPVDANVAYLRSAHTPEAEEVPVPQRIPPPFAPWFSPWFPYPMQCYGYPFQEQESFRVRGDETSPAEGGPGCGYPARNWQQEQAHWPVCPVPFWQPPFSPVLREEERGSWDHPILHFPASAIHSEGAAQRLLDFVQKHTQETSGSADVHFEIIVRMKTDSSTGDQDGSKPSDDGGGEKKSPRSVPVPQSLMRPSGDGHKGYQRSMFPTLHLARGAYSFGRYPVPAFSPRCRNYFRGDEQENEMGESQPWSLNDGAHDWMFLPPPPPPPPLASTHRFLLPTPHPFTPRGSRAACFTNSDSRSVVDQLDRGGEEMFGPSQTQMSESTSHSGYSPHYSSIKRRGASPLSSYPVQPSGSQPDGEGCRCSDANSNTPDTPSSSLCRLDTSLDGQRYYDASSSDLEEEECANSVDQTVVKSTYHSGHAGTQFQHKTLDEISRDSGSDDADSITSSRKVLPPSCEQAPVSKSDDVRAVEEEPEKTGRYVIPARRKPTGLSDFMSRRVIPKQSRTMLRRSFPTDSSVKAEMGMNMEYKFGRAKASRMFTTDSPPLCAPASKTSDDGFWCRPVDGASSPVLSDKDYPALDATCTVSQEGRVVLPASYAQAASKNCQAAPSPQPLASRPLIQSLEGMKQFKGEESCKTFFRGSRRLSDSSFLASSMECASSYTSRLMSDSRIMGLTRWGVEAYDAFFDDYKTTFIDTHCHLDFLFNREGYSGTYTDYREKNKDTYPSNYEGCVAVFCNPRTFTSDGRWRRLVGESGVWMAMGCHPKSATDYNEWADQGLRQCLMHPKTVALGEIGLDYSKNYHTTAACQKEVFIRQLKMALELKLPLVIHCREAEDDCLKIMEEIVPRNYKIHCHCFTGNYKSCLRWTSSFPNLFIGLTPLVTYHSATDTHEVAQQIPLERLLLETDAPYFLPCHFSTNKAMSMSHPGLALMVAVKVAELRNVAVEEVLKQVRINTYKMYGL